jgi:hypothetical protein
MAEVAAHLRDWVIPRATSRPSVLSVPKRMRPTLARDADLAGAVLRILLRVIHRAPQNTVGVRLPDETRFGGVSFLHRFGSALNPHFHFHRAVPDGLFASGHDGSLTFHPATGLDAETVRNLTLIVQRRILRLYARRGLPTAAEAEDMLGWRETGSFNFDGSVRVAAHDPTGLEWLLRGHRHEALVVASCGSSPVSPIPVGPPDPGAPRSPRPGPASRPRPGTAPARPPLGRSSRLLRPRA